MIHPIGLSLIFLLVLTPVIIHTGNAESPFQLVRAQLLSVFSFILFVQWLGINFKKSIYSLRFSNVGILIHGLTLAMTVSTFMSLNPFVSFWGTKALPADSLRIALYISIIVFVIDQIDLKFNEIKLIFNALNIVLLIQIGFALAQVLDIDPVWWAHKGEIFGITGNTISFSELMGILLINAIFFFLTSNKKIYQISIGLLLFFTPYVMLKSGSRTPLFVTLAATISVITYFLIKSDRQLRKKIFILIALLLGGGLLFSVNYEDSALKRKMSDSSLTSSFSVRKETTLNGFKTWKESPIFGNGPETYLITQGKYQTPEMNRTLWMLEWSKAHNAISHYLSNTGVVGTFFLVALFVLVFYLGIRMFFNTERSPTKDLSFCLIVAYCFIFIVNFTSFYSIQTQLLAAILPLMALKNLNSKFHVLHLFQYKYLFKLLSFVVFIGVSVLTFYSTKFWYADLYFQEARLLREYLHDSKGSFEKLEKAIKIFPYDAYNYCASAHSLNDMYVRNYGSLDAFERSRTSGIIDNYINNCLELAGIRQHAIFTAAKVYIVQLDAGLPTKPEKALDLLFKALEITPKYPELHFRIGLVKYLQGDFNEFELRMKKAIEYKIDYIPAHAKLAEFYYKTKKIDEAKKIVDDALKVEFQSNQFIPLLSTLAQVCKEFGQTKEYELVRQKYEVEIKKIKPNPRFSPMGTF
jgi:O-antigen ligase/tetratricopeptide (TPR) repeat protein